MHWKSASESQRSRFAGLVALQRTDQVPAAGRIDFGGLGHHFLDTVLADVGDPARDDPAHHVGGKGLGHGHNRDRAGLTPGALESAGNTLLHRLDPVGNGVHSRPT